MDQKTKPMSKEEIIKKAGQIILENFGEISANYYQEFYKTRTREEILLSLNELLQELVGPVNAKKQLRDLNLIK